MKTAYVMMAGIILASCSMSKSSGAAKPADAEDGARVKSGPVFDRDSAYSFVQTLTETGPRVPNTETHRKAGDWLAAKLRGFGLEVTEQHADLKAFDGTTLKARNIFAQINPEAPKRLLLLAHWDCRPWADEDPDPAKHGEPVPGANDGASGVGVILELARQLAAHDTGKGVDFLLVDAEDWGDEGDEQSWALGTQWFVNNPPLKDYRPTEAVLLDMVGSRDASFGYEYFSSQAAPELQRRIWDIAEKLGHGIHFRKGFGGAVTDDHVKLIEAGIPTVDIIDYRMGPEHQGFDPVWHTTADDMRNISPQTLGAVGETLLELIKSY